MVADAKVREGLVVILLEPKDTISSDGRCWAMNETGRGWGD